MSKTRLFHIALSKKALYVLLFFIISLSLNYPTVRAQEYSDSGSYSTGQDDYSDSGSYSTGQDDYYPQSGSYSTGQEDYYPQSGSYSTGQEDYPCPEDYSDQYPQCGGTLGLEGEDPRLTFIVTRVRDCNDNVIRYDKDTGRDLGQCAVFQTQPTPAPSSCPFEFKYSECTWTGPGIVQEVFQDCNGNYKVGRTLFQSGVCGDTTRASQPQPTPTPVAACDFKFVNTECDNSGPGFVHDVFINCMNNVRFRNVRFVRGTCGDVVAAPTPIPPVVINPTPVQRGTVVTADQRCPSGTDFGGIVGSNIICIQQTQNQNQVVTNNATASTGAVNINLTGGSAARTATTPVSGQTIVTSVPGKTFVSADTELPKTGLPLVAWAFPGLLPLGLRLRKFGSFKGATKNLGSFFWQKREFDK